MIARALEERSAEIAKIISRVERAHATEPDGMLTGLWTFGAIASRKL